MNKKEIVFSTEWFSIEQERLENPRIIDNNRPFYRILRPDGILVLAMTPENKIILVKQFRHSINQETLEFPCGAVEPDETALESASRELYEETGYRCPNLQLLSQGRVMMDRVCATEHAFFGTGAVKDPNFKPSEDIETVLVSHAQLKDLILDGQFQHLAATSLLVLAQWRTGQQFV